MKRNKTENGKIFGLFGLIGLSNWLLIAGGNWSNAANAGSRSRNANNYRWNTNTNIGCRFGADTGIFRLSKTPGWTY